MEELNKQLVFQRSEAESRLRHQGGTVVVMAYPHQPQYPGERWIVSTQIDVDAYKRHVAMQNVGSSRLINTKDVAYQFAREVQRGIEPLLDHIFTGAPRPGADR